jgi:hypothetical protein
METKQIHITILLFRTLIDIDGNYFVCRNIVESQQSGKVNLFWHLN